jgi:hypothetical protein
MANGALTLGPKLQDGVAPESAARLTWDALIAQAEDLRDASSWAKLVDVSVLASSAAALGCEVRDALETGARGEDVARLVAELVLVGVQIARSSRLDLRREFHVELMKRQATAQGDAAGTAVS